MKTKAVDR